MSNDETTSRWDLVAAGDRGVDIGSLGDLIQFAKLVAESGIVPQAFRNKPADCLVATQMGMELGLGPMTSLNTIDVIEGRASVPARLMGACMRNHPDCRSFEVGIEGQGDGRHGFCETRRGSEVVSRRTTFSLADAKQAGLYPGSERSAWRKYTDDMLINRAISRHGRRYWQEATLGLYTPEEVREGVREEINVTPGGPMPTPGPDPLLEGLTVAPATPPPPPAPLDGTGGEQEPEAAAPAAAKSTRRKSGGKKRTRKKAAEDALEAPESPAPAPPAPEPPLPEVGDPGPAWEPSDTSWPVDTVAKTIREAGLQPDYELIETWSQAQRDEIITWAAKLAVGEDAPEPDFLPVPGRETVQAEEAQQAQYLSESELGRVRETLLKRAKAFEDLGLTDGVYEKLVANALEQLDVPALAQVPASDLDRALQVAANAKLGG